MACDPVTLGLPSGVWGLASRGRTPRASEEVCSAKSLKEKLCRRPPDFTSSTESKTEVSFV